MYVCLYVCIANIIVLGHMRRGGGGLMGNISRGWEQQKKERTVTWAWNLLLCLCLGVISFPFGTVHTVHAQAMLGNDS